METERRSPARRKRKQRQGLIGIITVLSVALVALLAVMLILPQEDTKPNEETVPQPQLEVPVTPPTQATEESTVPTVLDIVAPVLTGAEDILIYQGDAVQYMKNIVATDDMDENPTLTVDRSTVDLNTPGVYDVTYTATDSAGNATSVTVKLTVMEKGENFVSLEVIYAEVDALLDEILTEEMTDHQKVVAIYDWIVANCKYIAHSDKDNWIQAGYRMMTEKRGDCFNYFGLCKLMLERENIPNIDVVKVPNYEGDSNHYWSLVSIDGGENYYHVDTSPRTVPVYFCLVTDKVMDDFSAGYRNCFNRDKSLYPPTPEVGP